MSSYFYLILPCRGCSLRVGLQVGVDRVDRAILMAWPPSNAYVFHRETLQAREPESLGPF